MNKLRDVPINSIDWEKEYKRRLERVLEFEAIFVGFVRKITFNSSPLDYALNLVFTKSVNCFIAARILCEEGLKLQSIANIRMGLENGWLGLLFKTHPEKSIEWMTLLVKQKSNHELKYTSK